MSTSHGFAAAARRYPLRAVPESAKKKSAPNGASVERSLARTIDQLRHAAALADASRKRNPASAAAHIVAILDDLERELRVLRSVAP